MDYFNRRMINSLAEDVFSAYNISLPIGNIDEIVGQKHLVGKGKIIRRMV